LEASALFDEMDIGNGHDVVPGIGGWIAAGGIDRRPYDGVF
jgi:hypothetical protein